MYFSTWDQSNSQAILVSYRLHFYFSNDLSQLLIINLFMNHVHLQKHTASVSLEKSRSCNLKIGSENSCLSLQLSKSIYCFQASEKKIGPYSYDINSQIGSGLTSKVYKGCCLRDKSPCAVKVIKLKKMNASSLQMLENEVQILKSLTHPNIIKCYSVYKTVKYCYIITEYCSGGDLMAYLKKNKQLSEAKAIDIIAQIIQAQKYMIEKGILHRDLKPANILYDGNRWKIADFGFAMRSYRQIKIKNNVGTPLYMPLQSLSANIYSPLTDIFSIGVIFYQMIAGVTPWQSQNEKDLIKRMKNLPFRLSQHLKVSTQTRQIIKKLCEPDSQKRMSKNDFMSLNLLKEKDKSQQKRCYSRADLKRHHSEMKNFKTTQNMSLLFQRSKSQNPEIDERTQIRNKHIQTAQIQYCRFLYYLLKNAHHLLISQTNKNTIVFVCQQHLHKIINSLKDDTHNWLGLNSWQTYKHSKKYTQMQIEIKRYYERYQQSYQIYRNEAIFQQISKLREDISELLNLEQFSVETYKVMIKFIASLIREANHNISAVFLNPSISFSPKIKANIAGLKSLYEYYELIQISLNYFNDYDHFERTSNIKVQIDYQTAPKITLEEYTELRQKLKSI